MKATNRLQLIIQIIALTLLLSGCSKQKTDKIGLLLHNMEGRWITDVKYLQEYSQKSGYELIIKNAEANENKQLAQVDELLNEGVGIIVIVAVNQNTAAGIVRKAHKNGVKVIAYDRLIRNADLDYLLTYEYCKIGEMMAEYATQQVPTGNYIALWGDASDANAIAMRKGQENILQQYISNGNINMVYKAFIEDWSDKNASHTLERVLNLSDKSVNVVLASNDIIAQSAIKIFETRNYTGKVLITGQDATLESCRLIAQNKQAMTIYKSTNNMAREAIELADNILKNNKIILEFKHTDNGRKEVPTLFLKPVIVTAANIRETVIADGQFTENEIFSN